MSLHAEAAAFLEMRGLRLLVLRRLGGGASQEIWLVRVTDERDHEHDIVLRRDMGGVLSGFARTRREEFALMQAARRAAVPVPEVLYEPLVLEGREAFFMEHLAGETIGRRLLTDPAYADARAVLPRQAVEALVAVHATPTASFSFMDRPRTPLELVTALERDLDACDEGHPALELGLRWLRRHAPPPVRTALVHGDFRMGNLVVGTDGLRGVLDWELAHIGDPDEDLGWFCVRAWRFGQDDVPAGGLATRNELLRLYRAAGGHDVTAERLRYWEIFGNVKWGIVALCQAGRHLRGDTASVELATLGRVAAEMEWETLHLLADAGA
jgi:aminoglycoside phosphotransferase (APT) family kinase protein